MHISEAILPSEALTLGKGESKQFARVLFAATQVKYKPKKGSQYKRALAQLICTPNTASASAGIAAGLNRTPPCTDTLLLVKSDGGMEKFVLREAC